tara:strand:+ start:221 stop:550 length:330 start_codon:yes stop_codon:yes gene_type:complete
MIIYNVTTSVDDSIVSDWLNWMRSVHINEVLACGIFIKAKISRVISEVDSNNTFAISYTCKSMKDLHQYQIKFAAELQKKHSDRYAGKVIFFRTIIEEIQKFKVSDSAF